MPYQPNTTGEGLVNIIGFPSIAFSSLSKYNQVKTTVITLRPIGNNLSKVKKKIKDTNG